MQLSLRSGRGPLSAAALSATTAVFLVALTACSSTGGADSDSSDGTTEVSYQTSWLPSVEYAGSYTAEEAGYYADQGVAVSVEAGGPDIAAESLVAAGSSLVGTSGADNVAQANANGADLVIIGADYQTNPFEIISPASAPLETPADLVGKSIGVSTGNSVSFAAFLAANGIDASSLTIVPVGFDMAPLTSGEVDAIMGFSSARTVTLAQAGFDAVGMSFQDYGMPLLSHVYFTTRDAIESDHDALAGFLAGQIRGWNDVADDPAAAVALTLDEFGTAQNLTEEEQTAQLTTILDEMAAPDGRFFTMSDDAIAETVETLTNLDIDGVTEGLFDTSILDDAYAAITE